MTYIAIKAILFYMFHFYNVGQSLKFERVADSLGPRGEVENASSHSVVE